MKQKLNSLGLLLFLVLILNTTSNTSARKMLSKQGEPNSNINNIVNINNSLTNLMGFEEHCQNEDEECLKRRILEEAHLDYIYTQHHNP